MFTGCTATCPIQGAIFADAASQLATAGRELRLLSISIDPLGDDAQALTAWLQRYGAQPQRWGAAVPLVKDVDKLLDFVRGRASGVDRHTAQAFLFDRHARLAYRTADMPAGGDLVALMRQLADLR
jgi:protein SCO1/2